jgi:Family of unknown function (DUF6520)
MKRIKLNFAIIAFICGTALAVTTSAFKPFNPPNVYNTNTTDPLHPSWQAIPSGDSVDCDNDTDFKCTGFQASPTSPVTQITPGRATLD